MVSTDRRSPAGFVVRCTLVVPRLHLHSKSNRGAKLWDSSGPSPALALSYIAAQCIEFEKR